MTYSIIDFLGLDPKSMNHPGRLSYHEELNNNENLLITIGDSWTWGDSIDGINVNNKVDSTLRLQKVYGKILKEKIGNCDWLNLAKPGSFNNWIVDHATIASKTAELNYKNIFMSVGLTDIGRDIKDYASLLELPNSNFIKVATTVEKKFITKLDQVSQNTRIKVLIGRNFTNTFEDNLPLSNCFLDKRWVDISSENWVNGIPAPTCHFIVLEHKVKTADKLLILDKYIPEANAMIDFLMACPLHYKLASKHPTEECHALWADYLHSKI